ncbi:hypothetical protein LXL04_009415 [Taraxacum kok-saghyz]
MILLYSQSAVMAKTKSIKNSIVTFNPHLFPQFLYLFSPKNQPRNSQLCSAPSMRTLIFFLTFLLAAILCCVAMNPFLNTPSLSLISGTASYSPLFLASLSSVFLDPVAADNNDAPVSLTTTAMVPLPPRSVAGNASEFWEQPDGEGYRPCLDFSLNYRRRSSKIAKEKTRFLVVVVSGGLFQIRNQIVDAVVIARILEAALVFPVLHGDDSEEFSEIFDVEYFRKTLKADIRVVSSLPTTHLVSWQSLENQIPHNVQPFWIRARFLKKLNEEGSLVLTGLDSKLSKNLPPDLQKLRCKVAFHALKFAKSIRELGNRIARRMWIEGPYVAIPLINKEQQSRNALEAARVLKESGAPTNARVYIASSESIGDDGSILPLKAEFPNVVTKEMLARDDELDQYRNKTLILTAIDYIVSLSSDVFVPSYDGHMVRALQGHRAYVGHRKFVTKWRDFKGQPEARGRRTDRDVIAYPVPECMCKH